MNILRALACKKCKEYLEIYPNNYLNFYYKKLFEYKHDDHAIMIVDSEKVKKIYKKFDNGITFSKDIF